MKCVKISFLQTTCETHVSRKAEVDAVENDGAKLTDCADENQSRPLIASATDELVPFAPNQLKLSR